MTGVNGISNIYDARLQLSGRDFVVCVTESKRVSHCPSSKYIDIRAGTVQTLDGVNPKKIIFDGGFRRTGRTLVMRFIKQSQAWLQICFFTKVQLSGCCATTSSIVSLIALIKNTLPIQFIGDQIKER